MIESPTCPNGVALAGISVDFVNACAVIVARLLEQQAFIDICNEMVKTNHYMNTVILVCELQTRYYALGWPQRRTMQWILLAAEGSRADYALKTSTKMHIIWFMAI